MDEQTVKQGEHHLFKGPDYRSLYVNWVQPSFTPFDISLLIAQASNREQAVPTTDPVPVDIELKGRLSFHPIEAKLVALLLLQTVSTYEKQFGKIPDPTGISIPKVDIKSVVGDEESVDGDRPTA